GEISSSAEAGILIEFCELFFFESPDPLRSNVSPSSSLVSRSGRFAVRSGDGPLLLFLGWMAMASVLGVGCRAVVVVGAAAGSPNARLLPMGTVLKTVTGRCVTISWATIFTVFTATLRVVVMGTIFAT